MYQCMFKYKVFFIIFYFSSFERPNIDLTVFQLNAIITKALQDLHGEVIIASTII